MILQWQLYKLFQLDLALKDDKGGDISSFIPNGEWDLIGNLWDHFSNLSTEK